MKANSMEALRGASCFTAKRLFCVVIMILQLSLLLPSFLLKSNDINYNVFDLPLTLVMNTVDAPSVLSREKCPIHYSILASIERFPYAVSHATLLQESG
eukprot:CAMPEP_0197456104 /NCGR_PEP_ID=MMETSP1175-20131217/42521_1 /TAXON_ID=1003142 /ORGANISM="Triceratium dubium, Strain CCMP147" /LENGTH=98 /DNA_ID=CAMNT_0042990123 /DNA_START=27 /DNA_END=319 /DNA_ORIENTATION=-